MNSIRNNLISTVRYLSEDIGERSVFNYRNLTIAGDYIEYVMSSSGCDVKRQFFVYEGKTFSNIVVELPGISQTGDGTIVIGAHYDTVIGTPGADDNASGISVLIELLRLAKDNPLKRTVHFVAFCLEEPPVFYTQNMGSYHYARELKEGGKDLLGMISLEMVGYYRDDHGSQSYPLPFFRMMFPEKGNFVAFVGNLRSRSFTLRIKESFKKHSSLSVESLNVPPLIHGVDLSDHRNFWKFGYRAFMVTDTAFYRNPNYHSATDRWETLDYARMEELVRGLYMALLEL